MGRPKKFHLFHSEVLRDAVLDGVPAKAICGREKLRTKADIDATKDLDLPLCAECGNALAAESKQKDVLIRERGGWDLFEKATRPGRRHAYTFRATITGNAYDFGSEVAS